ncbi:DUF4175 domain-containing protein [Peribacillus muralis]|uniref:hypothetical protein n=1 Tax=Peribacillus muralis TaxID=264697 RepID=UPI001F4DBC57|nr:hypothetical protein [Peribacillus muralis]MCK1993567.1 hypothetical protein [Peribacillus muralis]MCK2014145.1 hypothetical protein [Peribacillus muralis]
MFNNRNCPNRSCDHPERCEICNRCSQCNPNEVCNRKKRPHKSSCSCNGVLLPTCNSACQNTIRKSLKQNGGEQEQILCQSHGDQGGQTQGDQEQNQTIGDQEQNLTIGDSEQSQTIGDQEQDQNQMQTHGDQEQTQTLGDQDQNQTQTHGDQEQTQTLGDQDQNQTQTHGSQEQTLGDQTQEQSHGDQTLGDQNIQGHRNFSPLNNNQTIETTVSGVTVNLTTTCKSDYECNSCKGKCEGDCKECCKDSVCDDCCKCSLCSLVSQIKPLQTPGSNNGIAIHLTFPTSANPVEDQVITNIDNCKTVTYKESYQVGNNPSTTVPLKNISGISTGASSEDIFEFLLQFANNCGNTAIEQCDCNKSLKKCGCKNGIAEDLASAAKFGLAVNLFIEGQTVTTEDLFVLNVCDCLVFLVDDLTDPSEIFVFTICSINGYVIPQQSV